MLGETCTSLALLRQCASEVLGVRVLLLVFVVGCGDDGTSVVDGGVSRDGGRDGGARDAGGVGRDAGSDGGSDAGTDAGECVDGMDCDDGDPCTGVETCAGGACVDGEPLDCDDGDPCTADSCDPVLECQSVFVDEDRDGHAPSSLGPTCLDCDDTSASRYPGAPDRVCDGFDSDCDGTTDEDGFITYYADCDADGIAPPDAETTLSCATPGMPPAGCTAPGGSWSMFSPGTFADCRDDLRDVRPGTGSYFTMPIPGEPASTDYDYNCDDTEELHYPIAGECTPTGMSSGTICTFVEGWQSVPACGSPGLWIERCSMSPGPGGMWECNASLTPRTQDCR